MPNSEDKTSAVGDWIIAVLVVAVVIALVWASQILQPDRLDEPEPETPVSGAPKG